MTDLDRLKGYEHGAVDYISVPVIPELLRVKVKVFAELYRKSRQLETLNACMITLQDDERRRIARELHDGVGQMLAAISMNISVVQSQSHKLDARGARAVSENAQLIQGVSAEIRTMSHLLHPPLLENESLSLRLRIERHAAMSDVESSKLELKLPAKLKWHR